MQDHTPFPQSPGAAADSARLESLRSLTLIIYILYALSTLVGLTAIAAIIINILKRPDTVGTLYESHFRWQTRTFWFGLLWAVVGTLTVWIFGLGFVILAVSWIWIIYRIVRGLLNWNDRKPMPV